MSQQAEAAYAVYFGALNQRMLDSVKEASDSWKAYEKIATDLGEPVNITTEEGLLASKIAAAAKIMDVATLQILKGERKVLYETSTGDFAIEPMLGDVHRVVLNPSSPGRFDLVPYGAGEGGVQGLGAPLVPILAVGVVSYALFLGTAYLVVSESADAMKVVAQKRTENTVAKTAGSYAKLVADGKATPQDAQKLTDTLYQGSVDLAKAAPPPPPPEDTTGGKIKTVTSTIEKVAWIGLGAVVLYGVFRVGSTLLEQRALRPNPYAPRLSGKQSRKRVAHLKSRGCKVEHHRLPSGDIAVLRKC